MKSAKISPSNISRYMYVSMVQSKQVGDTFFEAVRMRVKSPKFGLANNCKYN